MPFFNIIDDVIKELAEFLGRSGPWHQRFLDLQDVFLSTCLELQGIHQVRWLSRGDAIGRLVKVLPAIVVMLSDERLCWRSPISAPSLPPCQRVTRVSTPA
ncbi:hypothetical protein CLOP_g14817 [Closterium sp. NIES-67]|nr:hypothetical protein CLOP_g14817 [Closterium sp. NIES-67]